MNVDLENLMARYNQLGRLLPSADDLDTDDIEAVTEARLIIQEMAVVKTQIDECLASWKSGGCI